MTSFHYRKCSGTMLIKDRAAPLNAVILHQANVESWQKADGTGLESNVRSVFLGNCSQRRLWLKWPILYPRLAANIGLLSVIVLCRYSSWMKTNAHAAILLHRVDPTHFSLWHFCSVFLVTLCSIAANFLCLLSRGRCVTACRWKIVIHTNDRVSQ